MREIAIIGAGPRGILTLQRLIAWHKQTASTEPMHLSLFDPCPIGGHVWLTEQPTELIVNTPAQQLTLFTDDSVIKNGPDFNGPHLGEWARSDAAQEYVTAGHYRDAPFFLSVMSNLDDNDYAPRGLFGVYIQWFYDQVINDLPNDVTVDFHQTLVNHIQHDDHSVTLQTEAGNFTADQLVMAPGHYKNELNPEEAQLAQFATDHHRLYLPPIHPADADLSSVTEDDTVIIRGLGLSFYDYVTMLTLGHGGVYTRDENGKLHYSRSGKEPMIIAGSRHGIPYYPKGHNQKAYGEQDHPVFLTIDHINELTQKGPITGDTFFHLLQLDVAYAYYTQLIESNYPHLNLAQFQHDFIQYEGADDFLDRQPFKENERLNWQQLISPTKPGTPDYLATLVSWLSMLVEDAKQGTKTAPYARALESLRDYRDSIRYIVETNALGDDEYMNFFLRWFNPNNDFLAVGPPLSRVEQLVALIEAGVVTLLKPGMTVEGEGDVFITSATSAPKSQFEGTVLLEARLPGIEIQTTANPILKQLASDGVVRPQTLKLHNGHTMDAHAILVDRTTDQLVDASGSIIPNIFLWGIPTEGLHWTTTTAPRPGVNDPNLRAADRIAELIVTGNDPETAPYNRNYV